MKKIILLIIAIAMVGLLFGCTSAPEDNSAMDKNNDSMTNQNDSMNDQNDSMTDSDQQISEAEINEELDSTVVEDEEINVGEMF